MKDKIISNAKKKKIDHQWILHLAYTHKNYDYANYNIDMYLPTFPLLKACYNSACTL